MSHEMIEKYIKDINELGFEKTLTLDSNDVAKIFKVEPRTIMNWAKEKIGPRCKKMGKCYMYTKRDVAEFLAQN